MKKWFYIANTANADPVFLHCRGRQVRGLGTVTEAESVEDVLRKVAKLRGELEAAAGEAMAANPADVDGATMELLNHADILTAADYERLYSNAESVTMKRLIADAAGKKAAGITAANDPERVKLRRIENAGKGYTAAGYLRKYDDLTDAFKRGIRNNHILDRWDELTGDFISQF